MSWVCVWRLAVAVQTSILSASTHTHLDLLSPLAPSPPKPKPANDYANSRIALEREAGHMRPPRRPVCRQAGFVESECLHRGGRADAQGRYSRHYSQRPVLQRLLVPVE
jgi:hypothetical protein